MPYECFISYASSDVKIAEELYSKLTADGFTVWFDKARLDSGCNWYEQIKDGAEASRIILPILTPQWQQSAWTKFETYGAEHVIPLLFAGTWSESSTPPLQSYQRLAFNFSVPDAQTWQRLTGAIRQQCAKPVPEKLGRLADVPYQHNPYFIGREKEMLQIHETLHQKPTASLTQGKVHAIAALGGMGKTTLVREYIESFWRCYPQIFWIDCRLGLLSGMAKVFDGLYPGPAQSLKTPEKAEKALRELNSDKLRLLVLDNAEDETSVQKWIPNAGACRTIITSRFAAWSPGITKLEMYVLDPEPARRFLLKRADRRAENEKTAACDQLAGELGYLPLALEQAAAYLAKNRQYSFGAYLDLYHRVQTELLKRKSLGSTQYPDPVATTWKVTSEKLSASARVVLRLTSFLASTPIPLALLRVDVQAIKDLNGQFPDAPPKPQSSDSELFINDIVNELHDYCLVRQAGEFIQVHLLVQAIERDQAPEPKSSTIESIMGLVDRYASEHSDMRANYKLWGSLIPHVDVLQSHILRVGLNIDGNFARWNGGEELTPQQMTGLELTETLCSLARACHETHGLPTAALVYVQRALKLAMMRPERDEEETLYWAEEQARLFEFIDATKAKDAYKALLAKKRTLLGEQHPETTRLMERLAWLLTGTGDDPAAVALYTELLARHRKQFGDDHEKTREGQRLLEQAQAFMEARKGRPAAPMPHHSIQMPLTASERLMSGVALYSALHGGDLASSEKTIRDALKNLESMIAPDADEVLATLDDLTTLLIHKKDFTEADSVCKRLLQAREEACQEKPENADRQKALGGTLRKMGELLQARGDLRGASESYQKASELSKRLAKAEPNNLSLQDDLSRERLASAEILAKMGDWREAVQLYRDVLAQNQKLAASDPDNPDWQRNIFVGHYQIARLLHVNGDRTGALEALHAVRAIMIEKACDASADQKTLQSEFGMLTDLANQLHELGDLASALQSYREALAISLRLIGIDLNNTEGQKRLAYSHSQIGAVLRAQKDLGGALKSRREALSIYRQLATVEPDSVEWQDAVSQQLTMIGEALFAQGDLPAALQACREELVVNQRLAALDPNSPLWQEKLAAIYHNISLLLEEQGDEAGVRTATERLREINCRLVALEPDKPQWRRNLNLTDFILCRMRFQVASQSNDHQAILTEARRAFEILDGLSCDGFPMEPQHAEMHQGLAGKLGEPYARELSDRARKEMSDGRPTEARATMHQVCTILDAELANLGADANEKKHDVLCCLSDARITLGDWSGDPATLRAAIASAEQGLAIAQPWSAQVGHAVLWHIRGHARWRLGELTRDRILLNQAVSDLSKACEVWIAIEGEDAAQESAAVLAKARVALARLG